MINNIQYAVAQQLSKHQEQQLVNNNEMSRKRPRTSLMNESNTGEISKTTENIIDIQQLLNKRQRKLNPWAFLPREVLYTVFTFLNKKELIPMGRVCQHWWQLSRTNLLWQTFDFVGFKVKSLQSAVQFFRDIFTPPRQRIRQQPSFHHFYPQQQQLSVYNNSQFLPPFQQQQLVKNVTPIRVLSFPKDCSAFGALEIKMIAELCPELRELKLPIVSPTQDVNTCQSITDDILHEIAKITNLRRLDLSTHAQITNAGLSLVTRACTNLVHLIVDHCAKITPSALIEAIRANQTIKTISALSCAAAAFTAEQLVELSQHSSKLENMSIELHKDLESDAVTQLCGSALQLKSLHLKGWKKIDGYSLSKLCQVLQHLEKLQISGNENETNLQAAILKSDSLQEVTLTRCTSVRQFNIQCPNLSKLHFESIQSMSELNLVAPKLNQFMLHTTNLENMDFSALITSLQNLKVLDILDCLGFGNLMIKSKSLNELSLYMCSDLEDLSVECDALKSMNVDVCMELKSAKVISPALQNSQWFTLAQPQFPLMNTLQLVSQKLQSLSLQRCVNLRNVELKCDKMIALNLADCKLLELLQLQCPQLEKLALSAPRVNFTPDMVKELALNCPRVHMLSLSHAPGLNDESLAMMCEAWHHLQALIISNCDSLRFPKISSKSLAGLQLCDCVNLNVPEINCPSLGKLFFRNSTALSDMALNLLANRTVNLKLLEVVNCPGLVQPRAELPSLMSSSFTQCTQLRAPQFFVPNVQNMVFTDCAAMDQLVFLAPSRVQEINFQNCKLSDNAAAFIANRAPIISNLVFNNCEGLFQPRLMNNNLKNLQFSDCAHLVKPFIVAPSLQQLAFKNCNSLQFQSLANEVLVQQQQAPQGASAAVPQMVMPRLNFLEFANCSISQRVDMTVLTERLSIANCNHLNSLYISNAALSKMAVNSCAGLSQVQVNGSQMTEVLIRDCPALNSLVPQQVRSIMCAKCPNFNDKSLEQVTSADSTTAVTSLKALILDHTGITNPSIRHQGIQLLKISNSSALADLHTELPALQTLDVQNCPLMSLQFLMKLNAISNFMFLRNLVLRDVHVTEAGLEKLLARVMSRSLQHVDVASSSLHPMKASHIVARFMQQQNGMFAAH